MNGETLKNAFSNAKLSVDTAQEARVAAGEARQEAKVGNQRMNEQVQLAVARAAGAQISLGASDKKAD